MQELIFFRKTLPRFNFASLNFPEFKFEKKRKRTCGVHKKTSVKIFSSSRLRIYSFTKNEVILRCSSKILVPPSAGSFTVSHIQIGKLVKHLSWHQNYRLDFPVIFRSTLLPPIMPYPLIYIKIFSVLPPIIQYFDDSRPWHDARAIACARTITRTNQRKGGLGGQ